MIIVEQSLNVALSIADRAVFMEKGQVRFEGVARELLERDDLAARRVPPGERDPSVVTLALELPRSGRLQRGRCWGSPTACSPSA